MLVPDILILNGSVRTMDPAVPLAEAVAISGNRFVAVGSTAALQSLAGPGTWLIDAGGSTVLPGFNDAHVHFLAGGFSLGNINLRDVCSRGAFATRLGEHAAKLTAGTWIVGGEWDHERWGDDSTLPDRWLIDPVTPSHPALISRLDGHMSLANTVALRLAGVTAQTPNPPGGLIVRDRRTGEPTGILKDAAEQLVRRVIPEKTTQEKFAAARAASTHAAECGVTSVTDMSADADVGIYQRLLVTTSSAPRHDYWDSGDFKTRIYAARSIVDWDPLGKAGVRATFGSDMLRIGAVKGFADGSLGSSTALFFEPYTDAPETRGLLFDQMLPEGIMLERALAADRAGLQVMIHAIGDEANSRILDLFAAVAAKNGSRDRRCRIEHAQHLRTSDIPRFKELDVVASMQPYHAADDGRWCEKRLGPARAQDAYVFRSLLDAGAALAFGSDWTVAPLNPLLGIKAAVTRQTLDGGHPDGWVPQQKIHLEEALYAYTAGSAYAEFAEHRKGSITVGKLADLVLLDSDLFALEPQFLDQPEVVVTIVDGRVVCDRL